MFHRRPCRGSTFRSRRRSRDALRKLLMGGSARPTGVGPMAKRPALQIRQGV